MAAEEIDTKVLEALATKIDGLQLSAQEAAVLEGVLARAASVDAEVQGFGQAFEAELTFKPSGDLQLTPRAACWGRAIGFQMPISPSRYIGETETN